MNKTRKGAGFISNAIESISSFGIRNGYNNTAKKAIKDYGNMRIYKLFIFRKPVVPVIENF